MFMGWAYDTEIGLGLTGFGIFFSFLGIIFFFDKGLLAMGNILFISGVSLTIGVKSTMQFFTKRSNFKGSISFGIGFLILIMGWPILGMIIEAYGFIVLFSGFWPTLAVFLQKIPILGWLFQQPYVRSVDVKDNVKGGCKSNTYTQCIKLNCWNVIEAGEYPCKRGGIGGNIL
ncbi:uncharacterized protein DS421_17g586760 [Arachis hypogaea]|nr:uncharacterized protein DS421_17g586760 [Arachis hypogaea]